MQRAYLKGAAGRKRKAVKKKSGDEKEEESRVGLGTYVKLHHLDTLFIL
jgi:hypothetical protein